MAAYMFSLSDSNSISQKQLIKTQQTTPFFIWTSFFFVEEMQQQQGFQVLSPAFKDTEFIYKLV